jgi:hypothetical protein
MEKTVSPMNIWVSSFSFNIDQYHPSNSKSLPASSIYPKRAALKSAFCTVRLRQTRAVSVFNAVDLSAVFPKVCAKAQMSFHCLGCG